MISGKMSAGGQMPWLVMLAARRIFLVCFMFALVVVSNRLPATDAPLLLCRIEVPTLMPSAQRLSALMEKSSPGSSAPLALGIAALALNPQFGHFDLTQPIVLFLYAWPESSGKETEWCFSMAKKSRDELPTNLHEGKTALHVKEVNGRCFIARNQALVELSAMVDLPNLTSAGEQDIVATLWPATGLERHGALVRRLQGEGARLLFQGGASREARTAARIYHLRFRMLEGFLRQCREASVSVRFTDAQMDVIGNLTPQPDSDLERFCHAQGGAPGAMPTLAALPENAPWSGASNVTATPAVRQAIIGFIRSMTMELSDRTDPQYLAVLTEILDAWDGRSRFAAIPGNVGATRCMWYDLSVPPERPRRILADRGEAVVDDELFLFLDQYREHAELRFGIYGGKEEVVLIQHAGDEAEVQAVRRRATAGTMVELPLSPGEVRLRRHYETTDRDQSATDGATGHTIEYHLEFTEHLVRVRCAIAAELMNRVDPKSLFHSKRQD